MPSTQDGNLLPKRDIFEQKIPVGTEDVVEQGQREPQRTKHTSLVSKTGHFPLVAMLEMA